ncbi:carboxymuconolactone decarboxylase family protein [Streptomyces sp. NPDC049837]|uniref:carboxymuconolactone decarboxylase family protein n=1 Tax=Streptomyces sp. NPDC049837 TaxID=3155277 RepID=UPI003443404F
MQARMTNPATVLPETMPAIQDLIKAAKTGGVPETILELVHLRASQINGCGFCVDFGARQAKKSGVSDEKLHAVAAWREAPYFSDAERAALALAEAATRLADRSDPVPDVVWDEAADHFDEKQLASIILWVATTNFFNRINVTVKQPAGVTGW